MSDTERIGAGPLQEREIDRPHSVKATDVAGTDGQPRPFGGLAGWIEARTGGLTWLRETLNPPIRGGARWHYAVGAALVAGLAVEALTGLLLLTAYSPSATTAWGSVYFITEELWGGWFVRGLHSFGAHALVILSVFFLLQKLLTGAYRAPRELAWWVAVGLAFAIVLGTLTGNALVWDQDGYWGWSVETGIAGGTPVLGPVIQRLIVGGTEFGNATLGRLFGLHVGLIPLAAVFLLLAWRALARRHGVPVKLANAGVVERAWPRQIFYNMAGAAIFVGLVVAVMLAMGGPVLEAPADPSSNYPARPAWFFLWLFELRKSFPGPQEFIATGVVPGALVAVVLLLPFLDRVFPRRMAHFLACSFLFTVLGGAGFLTAEAIRADNADPHFVESLAESEVHRKRALVLAREAGVPPDGSAALLARDPLTRGRALLESKCLGCHAYDGKTAESHFEVDVPREEFLAIAPSASMNADDAVKLVEARVPGFKADRAMGSRAGPGQPVNFVVRGISGRGEPVEAVVPEAGDRISWSVLAPQSAADLKGYGSRTWLRGLLAEPSADTYFGEVPQCGAMARWRKNTNLTDEQLDQIADFFEQHVMTVPEDLPASEWEARGELYAHPGMAAFNQEGECASCHVTLDWSSPNEEAPNLYGWGSPWYVERMIKRPGAPHNFGYLDESDQMPAFDGFPAEDLRAIVRYLKGDYLGAEESAPGSGEPPAR